MIKLKFKTRFQSTSERAILQRRNQSPSCYKINEINVNYSGIHGVALNSTVSRSNWNLEMLVFAELGKPEFPEKNPRSRDENQQQTQPTYDVETRATLVGGECSHHCTIPTPYSKGGRSRYHRKDARRHSSTQADP